MFLSSAGLLKDTPETDDLDLSRLFNYYTSRFLLGPQYLTGDPGSTARMALRAANKFGIARESVYPYVPEKENDQPTQEAYADALNHKIGEYRRIKFANIDDAIFQVRYALAKGWPVLLGLNVGTKLRDLPADEVYGFVNSTNPLWGGHEVAIVGYSTYRKLPVFHVKNSWGDQWCDHGYFKLLATVIGVDAIDIWVVQGFAGIERAGVDQTKPKVTDYSAALTALYRDILKREPDSRGFTWWLGALNSGSSTLDQARTAFLGSLECKALAAGHQGSYSQALTLLYRAVFNREPDAEGFAWWLSALTGAATIEHVRDEFLRSPEYARQVATVPQKTESKVEPPTPALQPEHEESRNDAALIAGALLVIGIVSKVAGFW
jgi:hypothetical protein